MEEFSMNPLFGIYDEFNNDLEFSRSPRIFQPSHEDSHRIRKIKWKDEIGENLEDIREIETKYEPYFKVFMTYKAYEKSIELLHQFEVQLNLENKENINHRLQIIMNHIQATRNYNEHSKRWFETRKLFPQLSDQVIGYDTV